MCSGVENEFISYVGPPDLHDGILTGIDSAEDTVTVWVRSYEGRRYGLTFHGVIHQEAIEPVGMMLYALCELRASPPYHRYVFANWDDEEPGRLRITAEGFQEIESQEPSP